MGIGDPGLGWIGLDAAAIWASGTDWHAAASKGLIEKLFFICHLLNYSMLRCTYTLPHSDVNPAGLSLRIFCFINLIVTET